MSAPTDSPPPAADALPAVWITRAEPGASDTAARVARLGFRPLVLPLLETVDLPVDPEALSGDGPLAFTSANGVRAFARTSPRREGPVYVVGSATAAAARAAGFSDIREGRADVAGLAARILADPPSGVVLHAAAREPAGDLAGRLAAAGRPARAVAVYAARETRPPADDLRLALAAPLVLVHSPRAARSLARSLLQAPARPFVLGLSKACLAPLAGLDLAGRGAPETPLETDLMNLLASRR
ncbi:MAG: uroporphyrinogen-III synthase [Phenylobacterium sp.]